MQAYALPRRRAFRYFPTTVSEERRGLPASRIAVATAMLALLLTVGFSIIELALKTADHVLIDRAMLTPPEQADVNFGQHRLAFPGAWLTSPLALDDEMATTASIRVPYDKLLGLVGASSALDGEDGTNPHDVVIRLQIPVSAEEKIDLLNEIYVPKSIAVSSNVGSGLTTRRFFNKTGYDGELLHIGREGAHEFVARCLSTSQADGDDIVRRPCIYVHPVSADLEAVVQFDKALLADWRMMGRLVDALINSVTVR